MKRYLLTFSALLVFYFNQAQDAQTERQIIESLFGNEKIQIVKGFVKLETSSNDNFWRLYNEFEEERKMLANQKYSLLNNYVKKYDALSIQETDEIMQQIMRLSTSQDKLIATYYKKVKKECGIMVAAQFYQIEWYLLSQIRTAILENIPVIGKLETKKN